MPAPQHAGPGGSERALAHTTAALPARRLASLALRRPLPALTPVAQRSLMLAGAVFAAEYAARSLVGGVLGRLVEPAAEQVRQHVQQQSEAITRTVITEWTVLERLPRR
jgi:hypothetical protein